MGRTLELLARAAKKSEEGWDKADALEAMYWLRQLLAVAGGLACGALGSLGLLTFVGFVLASVLVGTLWINYQDIDVEDFPDGQPIMMEGVAPSVSLFVLCWVTAYTLAQH